MGLRREAGGGAEVFQPPGSSGRHGDASQTPAAEEGGSSAGREAVAGEAGARAHSSLGPVARPPRSGRLSCLLRAADAPASRLPGPGSSPRLPEKSKNELGRSRGAIRGGGAGTKSEDERRKAAQKLTRVGATASRPPARRARPRRRPSRVHAPGGARAGGAGALGGAPARVLAGREDGAPAPRVRAAAAAPPPPPGARREPGVRPAPCAHVCRLGAWPRG